MKKIFILLILLIVVTIPIKALQNNLYNIEIYYNPTSFKALPLSLDVPDDLANQKDIISNTNDVMFYEYNSTTSLLMSSWGMNKKDSDGNKYNGIYINWSSFFPSGTTNYLGFSMKINYKLNGQTIPITYNIKFINAKIDINYVDESGLKIRESNLLEGSIGQNYNITPLDINGYDLISVPQNATGNFTNNTITVNFIYKPSLILNGYVQVNYLDASNNKIAESETLEGVIGSEYTTLAKSIDGYLLTTTPSNYKGIFSNEVITVNYIYNDVVTNYGKVYVNYLDESNNKIANSIQLEGLVKSNYLTKELKIKGYTLIKRPSNYKGTYIDGIINVNYVYKKDAKNSTSINKSNDLPKTGIDNSNIIITLLFSTALIIFRYSFKRSN